MSPRRHTLAALAALSLAPLAVPAQPAAAEAAIRQTLARYEAVLNAGDTEAIVGLYTADGVQMPPDAPTAVGRTALRGNYAATFQAIALKLRFTVDEVQPLSADTALLRSHSQGTLIAHANGDAASPAAFKELFVLKRQGDGAWRISHYSFASAPLAP